MKRIGALSPLDSFGIWMLGPALLKFGTEEQKVHYLTQIARGEIRWCQGYSEPGSGSDLVSLQTFGDDKGDHWVVNGSKIWTSRSEEHTSELQSLMRISYAVFCLKKKKKKTIHS